MNRQIDSDIFLRSEFLLTIGEKTRLKLERSHQVSFIILEDIHHRLTSHFEPLFRG